MTLFIRKDTGNRVRFVEIYVGFGSELRRRILPIVLSVNTCRELACMVKLHLKLYNFSSTTLKTLTLPTNTTCTAANAVVAETISQRRP